jgi:hypothetical protein
MKLRVTMRTLIFLGLAGALWAADPFLGTWKLNVAKSKHLPGDESAPWPRELIRTFEEKGADLVVTEKNVSSNGRTQTAISRSSSKGGPVTIEGENLPPNQTLVLKRIDSNTAIIERDQDGKPFRTGHITVSADGKTITVEEKAKAQAPTRNARVRKSIESKCTIVSSPALT